MLGLLNRYIAAVRVQVDWAMTGAGLIVSIRADAPVSKTLECLAVKEG